MTILIICVYAFNRNKRDKLYLPSTIQTSVIELLSPKIETCLRLTKSPKREHIHKLCLYMLGERNCLIFTSWYVPRVTAIFIFPDIPESRESNSTPVTRGISH